MDNSVFCCLGYFQSENYFKDYSNEIKELFTPIEGVINYLENNSNLFDLFPELKQQDINFCLIGVRRGDYLKYKDKLNPYGKDYYDKAIKYMNKTKYYILSDDFNWCKQTFIGPEYIFLENFNDTIHLYIIMLFNNYIISNSTFYWWGSYLSIYNSPNIIVPDKWVKGYNSKKYYTIYRKNMTIINRNLI